MIETLVFQTGYFGLFLISFLSATIVPLVSEAFVAVMPTLGYSLLGVLFFATAGNFLGSLTNYYLGKLGSDFIFARFFKTSQEKMEKAEALFQRWGVPVLFFAWVPVVGDPLTVVGGIFKVNLWQFSFWVLLGKLLRYLLILGVIDRLLLR